MSEGLRTRSVALAGQRRGRREGAPAGGRLRNSEQQLPVRSLGARLRRPSSRRPLASPRSPLSSRTARLSCHPPNMSHGRPFPFLPRGSPFSASQLHFRSAHLGGPRCHLPPAKGHASSAPQKLPAPSQPWNRYPEVSASGGSVHFGPRVRGSHKLQGVVPASPNTVLFLAVDHLFSLL